MTIVIGLIVGVVDVEFLLQSLGDVDEPLRLHEHRAVWPVCNLHLERRHRARPDLLLEVMHHLTRRHDAVVRGEDDGVARWDDGDVVAVAVIAVAITVVDVLGRPRSMRRGRQTGSVRVVMIMMMIMMGQETWIRRGVCGAEVFEPLRRLASRVLVRKGMRVFVPDPLYQQVERLGCRRRRRRFLGRDRCLVRGLGRRHDGDGGDGGGGGGKKKASGHGRCRRRRRRARRGKGMRHVPIVEFVDGALETGTRCGLEFRLDRLQTPLANGGVALRGRVRLLRRR